MSVLKKLAPIFLLVVLFLLAAWVLLQFQSSFPYRSNSTESWEKTSSIINGLITPILTFMSVILIWLTWRTSKTELEEARNQMSFQSNLNSLTIILDDLVQTINQELKPSSAQIENMANYFFNSYETMDDAEFERLFGFEKRDANKDKFITHCNESFPNEATLDSIICTVVQQHEFEVATTENLQSKVYGYWHLANYMLDEQSNKYHMRNIRRAITYCLIGVDEDSKFEYFSHLIFCKVSIEILVFFHKQLTNELETLDSEGDNVNDLLKELAILNKTLRTRDILEKVYKKYSYLDKKYIQN